MLNQCNFIGHLGNDPECRQFQDGTPVANFSIACSERWKDKQTGEQKEATTWVRCTATGKLADIIRQYLHKGSKVYVSGKLNNRKYQAEDGSDRHVSEIRVFDMKMLDSKEERSQSHTAPPAQPQRDPRNAGGKLASDFEDEQIPF
jgi:single-strand DNA-binding protein